MVRVFSKCLNEDFSKGYKQEEEEEDEEEEEEDKSEDKDEKEYVTLLASICMYIHT